MTVFLVQLFRLSMNQVDVSLVLCNALIVPIYYVGGGNSYNNFRLVALTSHLSKD